MKPLPIIVAKDKNQKLSKIQERFNKKVQEVEKLKEKLSLMRKNDIILEKAILEQILPMQKEIAELKIQFIEGLHNIFNKLNKTEKQKVSLIIYETAGDILHFLPENQVAINFYNLYSPDQSTYEQDKETDLKIEELFFNNMAKEAGLEDWDYSYLKDPAKMAEKLHELQENLKQIEFEENNKKPSNKREAKKMAEEAEEQKALSKTIKGLYTDLVKKFHPDLCADEKQKDENEKIMKEVTEAYEKEDIFTLLQLHIAHIQGENNDLEQLAEEQILHYIKFLNNQIQDVYMDMGKYHIKYEAPYSTWIVSKNIQKKIQSFIKSLQKNKEAVLHDIEATKDVKEVKQILKNVRISKYEYVIDFELFDLLNLIAQEDFDKNNLKGKKKK